MIAARLHDAGLPVIRLIIFVVINAISLSFAQGSDTLSIKGLVELSGKTDLSPYIHYYIEDNTQTSFSSIRSNAAFKPFLSYQKEEFKANPIWIKLVIENTSQTEVISPILYLGYREILDVYADRENKLLHKSIEKNTPSPFSKVFSDKLGIELTLQPQDVITVWVKSSELVFSGKLNPLLFSNRSYNLYKQDHAYGKMFHFGYLCLIMGLCLFLGLFAFVQSAYNKDFTYLFWALYLWSNSLLFFTVLDFNFKLNLISNSHHPWGVLAQYVVQLAYLLFLMSFLEIKKYDNKTYRIIVAMGIVLIGVIGYAIFAILSLNYHLREYADYVTFLTDLAILSLFIRIRKLGIPQTKLLLIGSIGVLFTGVVAALFDQFDLHRFGIFWLDPAVFFSLGVIFELVFFSLALSQRTLLIQLENQRLQENYTRQLEVDLAVRVETIQTQNKLLEEQRVARLTNDFEQKIAETEITALRTQMNPHFIFNCLNSIKLYTLENKSEAASDYLTKFSRLIRLVLENSRSEKVTLENELETLSLYAEMEVMRFKNKVRYQLNVAPEIDVLFVEIPPLLLQPFVENAIWHGLMHKEEGGTVTVDVEMPSDKLLHVEITDDGIGRARSIEYKSKSATLNKSFGMKVTNERIELINQIYKTTTFIRIIDLEDENGIPTGTKVIVEIPV